MYPPAANRSGANAYSYFTARGDDLSVGDWSIAPSAPVYRDEDVTAGRSARRRDRTRRPSAAPRRPGRGSSAASRHRRSDPSTSAVLGAFSGVAAVDHDQSPGMLDEEPGPRGSHPPRPDPGS